MISSQVLSDQDITNTENFKNKNDFNIILVNARSLEPKLFSLIDTMIEIDCQIAMITETWFRGRQDLEQTLEDMQQGLGYGCIRRDREGTGGGVAIVYRTGDVEMRKIKIDSEFEIVAALGRRTGQRRKIVVMVVYVPPSLDAKDSDRAMEEISNLVGTLKRKYNSPYFVIGGDFNKRPIEKELKLYPDLKLENTPPTRGNNHLDLIFTNYPQYITKAGVTDPIFNLEGTETDHLTVYVNAKMPRVPEYNTESYSYYRQTAEGDEKMMQYIQSIDWKAELQEVSEPDKMVEKMHSQFEQGMVSSYELKKIDKKELGTTVDNGRNTQAN